VYCSSVFPYMSKDRTQHNRANGGGVGFGVISKHLQKVITSALIMCSSCNAS
jgi:hypothetical protein